MDAKIILASALDEEINEVIACLENLVRPRVTVVFLVRYPLEYWPYLRDHWVTTDSVRTAMTRGSELIETYSWETQRNLAARRFAKLQQVLGEKGIEAEFSFYSGSLKAALRDYGADPNVCWMVRLASPGHLCSRILARMVSLFRPTEFAPSWSLFSIARRSGSRKQAA